jgi:hypothetical protein
MSGILDKLNMSGMVKAHDERAIEKFVLKLYPHRMSPTLISVRQPGKAFPNKVRQWKRGGG